MLSGHPHRRNDNALHQCVDFRSHVCSAPPDVWMWVLNCLNKSNCFVTPTSSSLLQVICRQRALQWGGHTETQQNPNKSFYVMELNALVTMTKRAKLIFLFSKHWQELKRRVTQQHTSWNSWGREFMSHFWSQAVSYFSRAWKSNCDRFSRKNANLWDRRQDLFWSADFRPLILHDLIWCEPRHGGCFDWFKTLSGGV